MATLATSYMNSQGEAHVTITYSVSSTNDTTTVKLTKMTCNGTLTSNVNINVTCDGSSIYGTSAIPSRGVTTTLSKSKSFSRGTTAASKTLTLIINSSSSVNATITVPALPSYAVTYNGNGSTGGSTASQTKYYGKSLTLRSNGFTRTNYVFKNWNTAAAGTGTAYAAGASYTANSAVTLYAQWYAPYTVSYNANGGSNAPSSQYKVYNQTLTLSTAKPTRTNYVFKNWNTNAAGTGTAYAAGASYTANSAVTLYAQWYAPYTVAYNANGGTGAPASQVKIYNKTLILSTTVPTRTDFVFTSWNTSSAGSGTSYTSGANYTANANATLYAQWKRVYSDPKASVVSVQRVKATTHEADDSGTSVAVVVSWSLYNTPSGTNHPTSVVVACNGVTETLTSLTGLTGTATAYLDAGCSTEQQYPVTVTLTDEGGASRSATAEGVVTTPYYPIDIRQGGRGVAIGGPSSEDALDVFMPVKVLPRSTSATETPLAINDGTDDIFAVGWDGTVDIGPTTVTAENSGLKVHGSNISTTDETASANLYGLIAGMFDSGGNMRSYLKHIDISSSGRQGVQVETRRSVNGANVYNGIQMVIDPSGNRAVVLSDRAAWLSALGYTAPTALPLASGCAAYSSGGTPRYARDGHVVSVWGIVKPTAEVAAGGTMTIGTLPAGYRPPNDIRVVCHGSYAATWLLTISTDGTLKAERYSSNGETYAAMTTNVWMPFSATFITTS